MLTHSSSHVSKSKLLPLILLALACTQSSIAQKFERNGDVVTYRNNKFLYPLVGKKDTQTVSDPVSGKVVTKYSTADPIPLKMNGIRIYNMDEVTQRPEPLPGKNTIELTIFKGVSTDLNKLPDGSYYLYVSNLIIDNKGKLVFYEYDGLTSKRNKTKVPAEIKRSIDGKIDSVINNVPIVKPGKMNNNTVIVRSDAMLSNYTIVVKKHKAIFTRE